MCVTAQGLWGVFPLPHPHCQLWQCFPDPLAPAQVVHCGGSRQRVLQLPLRALLPSTSAKPSPSFQAYTGRNRRSSAVILLYLSKGLNAQAAARCGMRLRLPQTSLSQQAAEVVSHLWDSAIPSTSSCVLCFPAWGSTLLSLVSPFFSLLADLFGVPRPPTGRGSAGDPHPPVVCGAPGTTSQSPQGGDEQQHLCYGQDALRGIIILHTPGCFLLFVYF